MKILHILSGFYPTRGGVETLVTSLSEELQKLDKIESVFVAPRYWKSRPDDYLYKSNRVYSIDIYRYFGNKDKIDVKGARSAINSINNLRKIFEIERPDLVHVHGVFELFRSASILADELGVPIIHHIHGELPNNIDDERIQILRNSRCLVAVSKKVAQDVSTRVPNSEIHVIPNGVSDPGLANSFDSIMQITFVGRLDIQKGLNLLVEALEGFMLNNNRLHLNIVGIGDHLNFQEMVANRGISSNVTFHGRCSHSATLEILRKSQLVVVPSTSIEGFSLVAAEANFMSLPVIASSVGGLPNTILHGQTGLIVPPSDVKKLIEAIEYYLTNPLIGVSHGLAGRMRMRGDFSMLHYAGEVRKLYQLQIKLHQMRLSGSHNGYQD